MTSHMIVTIDRAELSAIRKKAKEALHRNLALGQFNGASDRTLSQAYGVLADSLYHSAEDGLDYTVIEWRDLFGGPPTQTQMAWLTQVCATVSIDIQHISNQYISFTHP